MFGINKDTKVHFIGIGGIGMSGIAEVLLNLGYKVTGSDISENTNVKKLKKLGAMIKIGHHEKNIHDASLVVYSSAISVENPEYKYAHENRLPLIKRAEMLAELMRLKYGIAIAGTHGKTTTTSFLATILHESGYDPSHVIGGIVHNLGGHAKLGKEKFFIAEADESDGSFLLLNPVMSVITNIDDDHLDYYETHERLLSSFNDFLNKVPFYGKVALNIHDKNIQKLIEEIKKPYVTFGVYQEGLSIDVYAFNVRTRDGHTLFDLCCKGEVLKDVMIKLPGEHNVLNALGAISIATELGVSLKKIKETINKFQGVGRRVEQLYSNGKIIIIDDYAHHPTEISATLKALKQSYPEYKLKVLFEPHRFSRTRDCWDKFLNCFNEADIVSISDIYPASETPIENIDSKRLVKDINQLHPKLCEYMGALSALDRVINNQDEKSLYVTLGAGAIGREIRDFVSKKL